MAREEVRSRIQVQSFWSGSVRCVWPAFFSAVLNLVLALTCGVLVWGTAMAVWGTGSKIALFEFRGDNTEQIRAQEP